MSQFVKRPFPPGGGPRTAGVLLALALTGISVSGCMRTGPRFNAPFMLANPNERHPITVTKAEARLDLNVRPGSYGLTQRQVAEVYRFLAAYKSEKGAKLLVRAPSGGANERAVMHAFDDVRHILRGRGFTRDEVALQPYYVSGERTAPIRLSYLHYVAKAPNCPDWSEDLSRDPQNMPYPNFGCATQHNLAEAVANPRDLVRPEPETPRSSERRSTVWSKYVAGQPTGATWSAAEQNSSTMNNSQ